MILVFRMSEAMSEVSECDNNRVRQDDTAGITTDDLMSLQMQKTFINYLTCLISFYVRSFDLRKFTQDSERIIFIFVIFYFVFQSHLQM
jgi:hypothetical protein